MLANASIRYILTVQGLPLCARQRPGLCRRFVMPPRLIHSSPRYQGKPWIPRRLRIGPPCEHRLLARRFCSSLSAAELIREGEARETLFRPGLPATRHNPCR